MREFNASTKDGNHCGRAKKGKMKFYMKRIRPELEQNKLFHELKFKQKNQRKWMKLNVWVILIATKMRKGKEVKCSRCLRDNLGIYLHCSEKWDSQRAMKVWDPGSVHFKRNQWLVVVERVITSIPAGKPIYLHSCREMEDPNM